MDHVGVSRKIEDRAEARLRQIIQKNRRGQLRRHHAHGGLRRARGSLRRRHPLPARPLAEDPARLEKKPAPSSVHQDVTLTTGLIRDIFSEQFDRLVVDERSRVRQDPGVRRVDLAGAGRSASELFEEEVPIFDSFEIEAELEKTMHRKVWDEEGRGYLCIDQAEALIAVDINTGRFKEQVRSRRRRSSAATWKPRARFRASCRLRDIGGLIVIDFIDMASEENRVAVLRRAAPAPEEGPLALEDVPVSETRPRGDDPAARCGRRCRRTTRWSARSATARVTCCIAAGDAGEDRADHPARRQE